MVTDAGVRRAQETDIYFCVFLHMFQHVVNK